MLFMLKTERTLPALKTLRRPPALPTLKILPALPMLRMLPTLPILRMLPTLPTLRMLRWLAQQRMPRLGRDDRRWRATAVGVSCMTFRSGNGAQLWLQAQVPPLQPAYQRMGQGGVENALQSTGLACCELILGLTALLNCEAKWYRNLPFGCSRSPDDRGLVKIHNTIG